jgi:hypothetical protein
MIRVMKELRVVIEVSGRLCEACTQYIVEGRSSAAQTFAHRSG